MSKPITLPDDLYRKLELLARPFIDHDPIDVIRRLVDMAEREGLAEQPSDEASPRAVARTRATGTRRAAHSGHLRIQVDGIVIDAASVPDLYHQTLSFLAERPVWSRIRGMLPWATSRKRYLASVRPVHPRGNAFANPVEHRGVYMETNRSHENAVRHLERFLREAGCAVKGPG